MLGDILRYILVRDLYLFGHLFRIDPGEILRLLELHLQVDLVLKLFRDLSCSKFVFVFLSIDLDLGKDLAGLRFLFFGDSHDALAATFYRRFATAQSRGQDYSGLRLAGA